MFSQFCKSNKAILLFLFISAVICGIVFIGVLSSFIFMLSENGQWSSQKISLVFLATAPYSIKLLFAPFIKNTLSKYANSKIDITKVILFSSQVALFLLLSSLGIFEYVNNIIMVCIVVFLLTMTISIYDILSDYIRILYFKGKDLGLATSICTVGFRVGMFIAGTILLYIANIYGWKTAFVSTALFIILGFISTIFLPRISFPDSQNELKSIFLYIKSFISSIDRRTILFIACIVVLFKFSDSCINTLKPMFLQSKGFGKIDFANIQFFATGGVIFGGVVGGIVIYRVGTQRCINLSFLLQTLASLCFIALSIFRCSVVETAALINISTLLFGFSAVVLRTYIAENARSDINLYMLLLSFGSFSRTAASFIGESLVGYNVVSWSGLYIICVMTNIIGLFINKKFSK